MYSSPSHYKHTGQPLYQCMTDVQHHEIRSTTVRAIMTIRMDGGVSGTELGRLVSRGRLCRKSTPKPGYSTLLYLEGVSSKQSEIRLVLPFEHTRLG